MDLTAAPNTNVVGDGSGLLILISNGGQQWLYQRQGTIGQIGPNQA